jgi:hypothetical protein
VRLTVVSGILAYIVTYCTVGLVLATGVIALVNPVWYVRLHNRIFGHPSEWWRGPRPSWLLWHDPEAVRQSSEMRAQYRFMGFVFVLIGITILVAVATRD